MSPFIARVKYVLVEQSTQKHASQLKALNLTHVEIKMSGLEGFLLVYTPLIRGKNPCFVGSTMFNFQFLLNV